MADISNGIRMYQMKAQDEWWHRRPYMRLLTNSVTLPSFLTFTHFLFLL